MRHRTACALPLKTVTYFRADPKFVYRADVKSYYATISHSILFSQLQRYIDDPRLLDLLWQYMRRTIYDGGLYEDIERGISLGCPLSPLQTLSLLSFDETCT